MQTETDPLPPRTLYLKAMPDLNLVLDGPSLVVTAPGAAARRYPLRLLRQVLLLGPVALSPGVVEALLRQGISLALHDAAGTALGYLWPFRERPDTLADRLDVFWERPDWHWKYENWRRAQERRVIRESVSAISLPRDSALDLRPEAVERLWLRILKSHSPLAVSHARLLRAHLNNFAQLGFLHAGATLESLGRRTSIASLPADFAQLLLWPAYPPLLRSLAAAHSPDSSPRPDLQRQAAALFESLRPLFDRQLIRLLDRFDFFLGGLQ